MSTISNYCHKAGICMTREINPNMRESRCVRERGNWCQKGSGKHINSSISLSNPQHRNMVETSINNQTAFKPSICNTEALLAAGKSLGGREKRVNQSVKSGNDFLHWSGSCFTICKNCPKTMLCLPGKKSCCPSSRPSTHI